MRDRGLLFVLARSTPRHTALFNDWYDEDHVPVRAAVPGFRTARRYLDETEGADWPYVASYELMGLDVLASARYLGLADSATDRERAVQHVAEFDRRVYRSLDTPEVARADDTSICGSYLLCVWSSMEEADPRYEEWLNTEGMARYLAIPGWRRAQRYVLVEGGGPRYLTMHDIDSFDEVAYHDAADAEARAPGAQGRAVVSTRLFHLYRRFDGEEAAG